MRTVRLSPRAVGDLGRLPQFLEASNPRAALEIRRVLEEGLGSLTEFAERGHSSGISGYRELHVAYGRYGYFIRYRVADTQVLVTKITHARERR